MPKEHLNPKELFDSLQYGFSQIVTSQGGKTVHMSGQVAWNEEQQIVGKNNLRQQTWQALKNVETAVKAAGGTLADIVSMRIYIVHNQLDETSAISEALKEFFPSGQPPTTTWIGVHSLANKDFLIEIEAIAVIE